MVSCGWVHAQRPYVLHTQGILHIYDEQFKRCASALREQPCEATDKSEATIPCNPMRFGGARFRTAHLVVSFAQLLASCPDRKSEGVLTLKDLVPSHLEQVVLNSLQRMLYLVNSRSRQPYVAFMCVTVRCMRGCENLCLVL
eukprot:m.91936 g.91936  ORF g.91936 m.91936 type:complete len:142 (+) comp12968_c1_seq1:2583-3008(+)